jgi:hypothetical protein
LPRASAILLIVSFSFSLISPILSSNGESKLPSCCRRDGKHHCSMMSTTASGSQESGGEIKGTRTRCPLYPAGKAAPASAKATTPRPGFVLEAPVWSHPAAVAQTEARFRLSFGRAWQKRGPPSLLS